MLMKPSILGLTALLCGASLGLAACNEARSDETELPSTDGMTSITASDTSPTTGDDETSDGTDTMTEKLDVGGGTGTLPGCAGDGSCNEIDLLFVIDNSGTMGEEQLNLAANLPLLVEQLQNLTDSEGNPVNPSVQIMVTTTDMGHPLCTPFQKADYTPRQGAPVYEGCNARINRFTGLDVQDPVTIPEACTQNCAADIAPGDQFIRFDAQGSNVPNDDIGAALSCIGPQGIDGCGYEAPLESMVQAINPEACWNNPDQDKCANDPEWSNLKRGFLRPDATLAIAIVTDELDCSVAPPGGFTYFTDDDTHWNQNPEIEISQATSAVCWNAGVQCEDGDGDGVYEACASSDNDVLHPVDRYVSYLRYLKEEQNKEVVMLGILGVPPVTEYNDVAPYQPIAGGVFDLEYRDWIDGEYPAGDILPTEWSGGVTADNKRFEFGAIGPGCTGEDMGGNFTGQAIPPVRVREVCESLNFTDENGNEQVRCCIESICSTDFSPAIKCLTGIIEQSIPAAG